MSRTTRTNFTCAYRLVLETPFGGVYYKGPYQTYAAAKGQLTQETEGYYAKETTGYIEQTPDDAWERV